MQETLFYCALQAVVAEALQSLGLEPLPEDIYGRPGAAPTLGEQFERIGRASLVLAEVRRRLPVSEDDRRLLYRLVDAASHRLEEQRRLIDRQDVPVPPATNPDRPRNPPRTHPPAKADPTRTIRSRRWDPAGKVVKS